MNKKLLIGLAVIAAIGGFIWWRKNHGAPSTTSSPAGGTSATSSGGSFSGTSGVGTASPSSSLTTTTAGSSPSVWSELITAVTPYLSGHKKVKPTKAAPAPTPPAPNGQAVSYDANGRVIFPSTPAPSEHYLSTQQQVAAFQDYTAWLHGKPPTEARRLAYLKKYYPGN